MPKRKNRKAKVKKPAKSPKPTRKLRKITPTYNQQIAFKKLSEIIRKKGKGQRITLGKLLRESGYSLSTSKKPKLVTGSKGWDQLMKKHFPDNKLAEAEGEQLGASKIGHYTFPGKENNKEIKKIINSFPNCKLIKIRKQHGWKRAYFYSPDNLAIGKSLDRIYKLKKKYPAERIKVDGKVEQKIKVVKVIQYVRAKSKKT